MRPFLQKTSSYFWLAASLLGLIFFPVFIATFGAHTDGFYIITKKGDWLGNPEGAIIFMQGRPLLTFLTSFIGWFTHSVGDFTVLRILSFLTKIWLTWLIYTFCCRIRIKAFWAILTAFCFVLLPGNIINVIWIANGFPSSLALTFGVISYLLLTSENPIKKSQLAYSAILFLISLLIYQPVAMIIFSLMFIKVLFSEDASWASTRNTIIKEIFFYGSIMVVYWLLVKFFIIPLGQNTLHLLGTNMGTYKMELAANLSSKYSLIIDLLRCSLIGTWDTILYKNIKQEWAVIILFWIAALGILIVQKKPLLRGSAGIVLQKTIACVILFLLSNIPSLMAVNSTSILGYRTFLPSGLIGLSLTIYYFKYCHEALSSRQAQKINNYLLGLYVLLMVLAAAWVIRQSVHNYTREYSFIDKAASHIDYEKTDQIIIVFNRPGDTVIDHDLPFEFGLMATNSNHIRYIFDKYSSKFNKHVEFKEVFIDWPVYADDHGEIVDLTSLRNSSRNNYAIAGKKIKIKTTASDDENVSVQLVGGNLDYPKLLFKETIGSGDNYWHVNPGQAQAGFSISFINAPEIPVAYKLGARTVNTQGQSTAFSWSIQGSNDQKHWTDLTAQKWDKPEENTEDTSFIIPDSPSFNHLRFLFNKDNPEDILLIKTLELYSFETGSIHPAPKTALN